MAIPLYNTDLRYSLTFKVSTLKIRFTDLFSSLYSSTYGLTTTNIKGILNITGSISGVVYQNAGWATTSFSSPDIDGNAATWYLEFDFPDDVDGLPIQQEFTVEYMVSTGAILGATVLIATSKAYTYTYTSPTVIPSLTHVCRTALITGVDDTSTDYLFGSIVPTISRTKTITEPSGTTRTPAGSTTNTTIVDTAWSVGGTSDPTTSLWSGDWQLNIVSGLTYDVETWGVYNWIVITDTVSGYVSHSVQCTDCACILNQCIANFFDYAIGKKNTNPAKYAELQPQVVEVLMRWMQFEGAERCGEEYDAFCDDIKDIVKGSDCFCLQDLTTSPQPIYPVTNTTTSTPAIFTFSLISVTPSGTLGWDWAIQWDGLTIPSASTFYYLWQNVGGTAYFVGNLKGAAGAAGAAGANGSSASVLWNDTSTSSTPAGTGVANLKTYTLPANILGSSYDVCTAFALFEFALNDNGKTIGMTWGGNELITGGYYIDDLVNAENKFAAIRAMITRDSVSAQTITAGVERYGKPGSMQSPLLTKWTALLSADVDIVAWGQNEDASAADIMCKQLEVELKNVSAATTPTYTIKEGSISLTGGAPAVPVTFADPFTTTDYAPNLDVRDISGEWQPVTLTAKTTGGFYLSSLVDVTVFYTCVLV